jgi:hypothetical protein
MSGLEMLDALIGLFGIYLTLSLLVTAIGEGISQAAGMRGRNLRQGFTGLIGKNRTTAFYLHPRIRQLMQHDAPGNPLRKLWLRLGFGLPSYIPTNIAIEVLLEQQLGAPCRNYANHRWRSSSAWSNFPLQPPAAACCISGSNPMPTRSNFNCWSKTGLTTAATGLSAGLSAN